MLTDVLGQDYLPSVWVPEHCQTVIDTAANTPIQVRSTVSGTISKQSLQGLPHILAALVSWRIPPPRLVAQRARPDHAGESFFQSQLAWVSSASSVVRHRGIDPARRHVAIHRGHQRG